MIYYNLADQEFKATSRSSVGVFNVSSLLAINLAEQKPVTLLLNNATSFPDCASMAGHKVVGAPSHGVKRVYWDQWGIYDATSYKSTDWLFLPKGYASFLRRPKCKLAVYIHDDVYSYWRAFYPKYRSKFLHYYYRQSLKSSLRHADVIFTNSTFTKSEVLRVADETGIKNLSPVIPAGIGFDHLSSAPTSEQRKGILVYISAWPHKQSADVLKMIEKWQTESQFDEPIYILGSALNDINHSFENWIHKEAMEESEYRALVGSVRCTVYHSAYEGFGMPPGESLLQGAVPVYSSIPATEEVMNGVGFPYENEVYESFSFALNQALSVSGSQIEQWKKAFMMQHNWEKVIHTIKQAMADGI